MEFDDDISSGWEAPPVFLPVLVKERTILDCAQPLVIRVDGLDGHYPSSCDSRLLKPWSTVRFTYEDTHLVGEHASETSLVDLAVELLDMILTERGNRPLMIMTSNLGGSIVKKAILIASETPVYQPIFKATRLLIFFGSPHRASVLDSWERVLRDLIFAYGRCLMDGPFLAFLKRFSHQHQELLEGFNDLMRDGKGIGFNIINYYEDLSPFGDLKPMLSKYSATFGYANEDCIGVHQRHVHLGNAILTANITTEKFLRKRLMQAHIGYWQEYKDFIQHLSSGNLDSFNTVSAHRDYASLSSQILSHPLVGPWDFGTSLAILRLELGPRLNPERLLGSLVSSVRRKGQLDEGTVIFIAPESPNQTPLTETQILASLLKQLLQQQPGLYKKVRHLSPILENATISQSSIWTTRVLWRCLKLLLYSPKSEATYCFVHVDTSAKTKVALQIISAIRETEIPLRMAISARSGSNTSPDISVPTIDLDLQSEELSSFSELLVDDQVNHIVTERSCLATVKDEISLQLKAAKDFQSSERFLSSLEMSATQPANSTVTRLMNISSDLTWQLCAVSRCIEYHGPWVYIAMLWAAYSLEPLLPEQLEAALAVEELDRVGEQLSHDTYCGGFKELQRYLPGIFDSNDNRVKLLLEDTGTLLKELWSKYMDGEFSPHAHIARICVSCLNGPANSGLEDAPTKLEPQEAEPVKKAETEKTSKDGTVHKTPEPFSQLSNYAAKHWLAHYLLENDGASRTDEWLAAFINDNARVSSWLNHVYTATWPVHGQLHLTPETLPKSLRTRLAVDSKTAVRLSHWLYSHPLLATANVEEKDQWIFVAAVETGDAGLVHNLTHHVAEIETRFLIRAIAAASGILYRELMGTYEKRVEAPDVLALIYLTSLALGNSSTADLIKEQLATKGLDAPTGWLHTSMIIAGEYGIPVESTPGDYANLRERIFETESDGWNALQIAIANGNFDVFSELFKTEEEPKLADTTSDGRSIIFLASAQGLTDLVKRLVPLGGKVNEANESDQTPLHLASSYGFTELVTFLLNSDADLTAITVQNDTPLHFALQRGHREVAGQIIAEYATVPTISKRQAAKQGSPATKDEADTDEEASDDASDSAVSADSDEDDQENAGVPFDIVNVDGETPLTIAVMRNFCDIAERLLQQGLETNVSVPDDEMTPLHWAARHGSVDIMQSLIDREADLDAKNNLERTPLHLACVSENVGAIEVLLKNGVNLTVTDAWGEAPLSTSCSTGKMSSAKILLPLSDDKARTAAILEAAKWGESEIVEFLLDTRAVNIDSKDEFSNTPLQFSAFFKRPRITQILLLRNAQIELKDDEDHTPVIDAARSGAAESLRLLIRAGADMEARNRSGHTALSLAIDRDKPDCVKLLLENGANVRVPPAWSRYDSILDAAVQTANQKVIDVLVHHYAKAATSDITAPEALQLIIRKNRSDVLQLILDVWGGANETVDNDGTSLHYAAKQGRLECARTIIEHPNGVKVNAISGRYGTVMQSAIWGPAGQELDLVKLCFEKEADPTIVSGYYGTSLNAAANQHLHEVVELILSHLSPGQVDISGGRFANPVQSALSRHVGPDKSEKMMKTLDFLIKHGASVSEKEGFYRSSLHAAAKNTSSLDIINKVLEHSPVGIRDFKDQIGRLPLHLAAANDCWEAVETLSTARSTIRSQDYQGRNALHFAAASGAVTVIEGILGDPRFADMVDSVDHDGWTPLHWACRQSSAKPIELLISHNAKTEVRANDNWTPRHVTIFYNTEHADLFPRPTQDSKDLPVDPGRWTTASCDSCFGSCIEKRHHCISDRCIDFDLCIKCYAHVEDIHYSGHEFEELPKRDI